MKHLARLMVGLSVFALVLCLVIWPAVIGVIFTLAGAYGVGGLVLSELTGEW